MDLNQAPSALDHYHKGFRRHAGVRVQHPKPVTTRLPKLGLGSEPARLVGLRRQREIQPPAPLPALHPQKAARSTAVRTLDSNGFEGPGRGG